MHPFLCWKGLRKGEDPGWGFDSFVNVLNLASLEATVAFRVPWPLSFVDTGRVGFERERRGGGRKECFFLGNSQLLSFDLFGERGDSVASSLPYRTADVTKWEILSRLSALVDRVNGIRLRRGGGG